MIKVKENGQTVPVYTNGYSVFVNNPNNPTGDPITLEERLSSVPSNEVVTIDKESYNEKAVAGTLEENIVYLVQEV